MIRLITYIARNRIPTRRSAQGKNLSSINRTAQAVMRRRQFCSVPPQLSRRWRISRGQARAFGVVGYEDLGKLSEAIAQQERAVEINRKAYGKTNRYTKAAENRLSKLRG